MTFPPISQRRSSLQKRRLNKDENFITRNIVVSRATRLITKAERWDPSWFHPTAIFDYEDRLDGFSIGSNDLTQLTLGADRDSELLSGIFSPFDPAVMQLIRMTLSKAKKSGTHTGLCGQAAISYTE